MKKNVVEFFALSFLLRFKDLPIILLAQHVGALRGAIRGWLAATEEAFAKSDARARMFEDRYLKEWKEERAGMSKTN